MIVCKFPIPSDRPGSQAGSCPNPPTPSGYCQEHFENSYPPDVRTRRQIARDLEAAAVEAAKAEAAGDAG